MKWIECNNCHEEFRVISDALASVEYCPFCGDDIVEEELDEEFDEDYE